VQTSHLVRVVNGATPGRTLCGLSRFDSRPGASDADLPGWSMGGGVFGPNVEQTQSSTCWNRPQPGPVWEPCEAGDQSRGVSRVIVRGMVGECGCAVEGLEDETTRLRDVLFRITMLVGEGAGFERAQRAAQGGLKGWNPRAKQPLSH